MIGTKSGTWGALSRSIQIDLPNAAKDLYSLAAIEREAAFLRVAATYSIISEVSSAYIGSERSRPICEYAIGDSSGLWPRSAYASINGKAVGY